jgi:UPF0042 nucleotide-binding protein
VTDFPSLVVVQSFGWLHPAGVPLAHVKLDLRHAIRNPHDDPTMRELTGLHPRVRARVLETPGATEIIDNLVRDVCAAAEQRDDLDTRVAVGCQGGRHRSVVVAAELVARLTEIGYAAQVHHRDVHLPVVQR